ncbi:MAG: DUF523 and DUF1722 domain-containing protein [Pseudomonadota bacterium]
MGSGLQNKEITIGISSCLLGQAVRYDGRHQFDPYINGTLKELFDFVPVCPEVAIGLPVPRPPIHLVRRDDKVSVLGVEDKSTDVTEALHAYGKRMGDELEIISGYIFKSSSPSCGMEQVRVYDEAGSPVGTAAGAFAYSLMKKLPLLPVEEEVRLGDTRLRENFIMRVFVYHRWKQMLATGLCIESLQEFHADHQYLMMAHSPSTYERMGQMLTDINADEVKVVSCLYMEELMMALKRPATRGQHVEVLQQLLAHFSGRLGSDDKAEMVVVIKQYGEGVVPLIVPITLLKHHLRRHPDASIERQVYLSPHPGELMLSNQA